MRLVFGPDDADGFDQARRVLLDRFEEWVGTQRGPSTQLPKVASEAGLALDWKWGYGDGDLGRWTVSDIREYLLEWCPRKVSVSPAEAKGIPTSLGAFVAFLGKAELLRPGSSPARDLAQASVDMTDGFMTAMDDTSKFGMAKSLFTSADALRAPRRPPMPPVVPPDDGEVAASRAAAPILARFAALAEFVGPSGRKLTQTGNLTLADARVLVDLLQTGDVMDPQWGDRTFKTTSAADLWGLRQTFTWARKAGVVRVAHGRVHATKKGLAIAEDPAGFFDRAVDALLAVGPLASQRKADGWFSWPEVTALLDRFTVALLCGPYIAQRPLPIEVLCDEATVAVLGAFEFRQTADDEVARRVSIDVTDMVDALELAGMVRRLDTVEGEDAAVVGRRRLGGSVELTAAGVVTTGRLLVEAGYEAPTATRFSDATATELLLGTDGDDFAVLTAEIEAWRRWRSPDQAARELAEAVRDLRDPALANLALVVMGEMDLGVAGPEVRSLAAEPDTRGFALCWLVDHGLEDRSALFDPDDLSWFVDVLAHRAVTGGPDGVTDTLALAGDHDRQAEVISRLWRLPSTATEFVLAAIAELHPVKKVAKAARKALFQRRSWNGPS